MFAKMIEKIDAYLDEALECESLVISTILNLSFRLAIFESHFQRKAQVAKERLLQLFDERKTQTTERILEDRARENETTSTMDNEESEDELFTKFSGPNNEPGKDEVEMYLGGMDCINHGEKKDYTSSALKWWKVNSPKFTFPNINAIFSL